MIVKDVEYGRDAGKQRGRRPRGGGREDAEGKGEGRGGGRHRNREFFPRVRRVSREFFPSRGFFPSNRCISRECFPGNRCGGREFFPGNRCVGRGVDAINGRGRRGAFPRQGRVPKDNIGGRWRRGLSGEEAVEGTRWGRQPAGGGDRGGLSEAVSQHGCQRVSKGVIQEAPVAVVGGWWRGGDSPYAQDAIEVCVPGAIGLGITDQVGGNTAWGGHRCRRLGV